MFTLYYRAKGNEEDLILELPCKQEEYTEVMKKAREKKPYRMDTEHYFCGVTINDDISSLNVLAYLVDVADDGSDKFNDWMEFGKNSEYCSDVDEWISLMSQYDDVEYTSGKPDYEEIGSDYMDEECSSDFVEKFNSAGLDISEIGELVFGDWDTYVSDNGWFNTSDYLNGADYDYPDEYMLEEPVMYEPIDLRDREVLKDLFARTVYKDSNPKIVGFIVGCYINEDPTKCTVRIMGEDYTAEELMEFKDFYTEKPMAREITE